MGNYKINEIFYSLQGEGFHTGRPAVFIRFSGCNLRCPFCDTQHGDGSFMTEDEIISEIRKIPTDFVVLTGGEPSLFINTSLIDRFHAENKFVAIETNGTKHLPENVDWITLSPKTEYVPEVPFVLTRCSELKVLFRDENVRLYPEVDAQHRFLQPIDTGNDEENKEIIARCIAFLKKHPQWRLSLQTHKLLGIR